MSNPLIELAPVANLVIRMRALNHIRSGLLTYNTMLVLACERLHELPQSHWSYSFYDYKIASPFRRIALQSALPQRMPKKDTCFQIWNCPCLFACCC